MNFFYLRILGSNTGGQNNFLYRNNGDGTFEKIITGIIVNDGGFSHGASWADYDNDGYLDLFVASDAWGKPKIYLIDRLYHNNGDGTFTKILTDVVVKDSVRTKTGIWGDYDGDGYMDLLCTPGHGGKSFFHNNGDGSFTKITTGPIATYIYSAWSASWVDYDNDLDLDLFLMGSFNRPNALFQNNGDGTFTRITNGDILTDKVHNNGGHTWGDYDNDGDLDVFLSNFGSNFFYINNGDGTFTKETSEIIVNDIIVESYAPTWADYDNDGDLDLYVPNAWGAPNSFFYINNGNANHWINIKCKGVLSNASAVGARVYVKANIDGNDVWQMREVNANSSASHGGVNPLRVHFGFGDATVIDTLKIVWPASGITQIFTNVQTDQFIEITEDINTIAQAEPCVPDLLPENPGFITGQVYNDDNGNCVFDSSDFPLTNQIIQATPGPYFTLTDRDGNYEFRLEPGTFTVSRVSSPENIWDLQTCQPNSSYNVTVGAGDTDSDNNFLLATEVLGVCTVTVDITHPDIIPGPCPPPPLSTPCPGFPYFYCFTVENDINSPVPIPANSVLQIILDPDFDILLATSACNITLLTGLGFDNLNVQIDDPILPGQSCDICIDVFVDPFATAPFLTQAIYTVGGPLPNLIFNGDFELGNVGFATDYPLPNCIAAPASMCVGPDPQLINGNHTGINHTPAGALFLFADGHTAANMAVWEQNVLVNVGNNYVLSAWFDNIVRTGLNLFDPNMRVEINGTPIITTGGIPEIPDGWFLSTGTWNADAAIANIRIRSLSTENSGNDFGIDDIEFFETDCGGSLMESIVEPDTCSCDPNDKLVGPKGCGPDGNIGKDETLIYTINFENIGTGVAFDIVIRDVLDTNLDITTLRILSSSNTIANIQIIPGNALIISFDDINLPGIQFPADNKGFVVFSIEQKDNLPDGTRITNQAGIIFDRNDVVMTNTTLNTIRDFPEPVATFESNTACTNTLVYDFTYTGGTSDNASFDWDFGLDATPSNSTDENPVGIEFSSTGIKTVILTVTRFGCTASVMDTIEVAGAERCGKNNDKIFICHTPPGNPGNARTLCINPNDLSNHINHGDCVGPCSQTLSKTGAFENNEDIEDEYLTEEEKMPDNMIYEGYHLNIYPNPFKEGTTIGAYIPPHFSNSEIIVYDVIGNTIRQFNLKEGHNFIEIKEGDFGGGLYFYSLISNGIKIETKKMIHIR